LSNFFSEKKRILCVEDDEDTCELLTLLLSDFEIVFTDSIEKSIALFKTGRFDLCSTTGWLTG
jgi:CheY-like chemotaxis protein